MTVDALTLRQKYQDHLYQDILPFWEQYCIKPDKPGLITRVDDHGNILSTDRIMWAQLRSLWVFSALYQRNKHQKKWKDIAEHVFLFVKNFGRNSKGRWNYCLDEDGSVIEGPISLYTDGFAIYGLTEYYRVFGDNEALQMAEETYLLVKDVIRSGVIQETHPYPIPVNCRPHGISMLYSLVCNELYRVNGNLEAHRDACFHSDLVLHNFYDENTGLIFEVIPESGGRLHGHPLGNVIVPGHAIESCWFQFLLRRDDEPEMLDRIGTIIRNNLEIGWDNQYGGIFLAVTADGKGSPQWENSDKKAWWPHCEALVALLMLYKKTGWEWCIEWFQRIDEYVFNHYPNRKHGDWYQNLDRYGKPVNETIGLPGKDVMHHIRAFIYCIDVLHEIIEQRSKE